MIKIKRRDSISLDPHWHVDCRLEKELPEDNIVSSRFLANLPFVALAFAFGLFFCWLLYSDLTLRHDIADWERRIADSHASVLEVQNVQRNYALEAAKIDEAYVLVGRSLLISDFAVQLGRTRPDGMIINDIESGDADIIVERGTLRESSERASRLLGHYVELLHSDAKVGPHFQEILLTGLNREKENDLLSFEITFRPRPAAP